MNILLLLASYLIGAIPFGLLWGKLAGKDVRLEGSRNIGATNVSRLLGKKLGFLTLLCDCLKGYLPMALASALAGRSALGGMLIPICGILAVVGHMFPVYLGFKGGKGVATGLGVFLYFSPAAIGISLVVFVAAVATSGFVSVGSLMASALMPAWLWLLAAPHQVILAAAVIAGLIWLKHHENISRLLQGTEKSWKKR